MPFTPSQQQAIDAQNRELLVSAAAGSGKTSVLVERIVRMIAQERLSIDKMLIVTFTRAAAGEMRDRLEKRLASSAQDDAFLRRQADLVATAQISTIHSFCQKTVRRYFQFCQIDPQFGLCDERTRAAFYDESLQDTLDWLYAEARTDEELKSLTDKYQEREIAAMLGELYQFLMSRPDPMQWLDRYAQNTWDDDGFSAQPAARAFCEEAGFLAEGMLSLCDQAVQMMQNPAFHPKLAACLLEDRELLTRVRAACDEGLDSLMATVSSIKFGRFPVLRKLTGDESSLCEAFRSIRDRYKDMLSDIAKLLPGDIHQAAEDLRAMIPATRGMCKTVHFFHDTFQSRKREQAVIDFNDLEHMTLAVLRDERLQQEMSRQFDAIFVDEYQDVSQLQEAILNGLKRGDGPKQYAFYVGDVKQSIYRFRQAEPGLFLGKLASFSPEEDASHRRIVLNRNFRSKTAVLDAVNRVFDHVMDSRVTEIDYDDDAKLYPGIPSKGDPTAELHILASEECTPKEQIEREAVWIARDILATVGQPIVDANGDPCGTLRFGDVAILLPVSKNVAPVVEKVLREMNVPVYCEGAADPMQSEEMVLLTQYLCLMDNLMNDLALLSVLRSPLFDMTEPELADIRLLRPEKEASFLNALMHAAENAPEPLRSRCAAVMKLLVDERFQLNAMPMADYLWSFLTRSGLYAHYGAQPGGRLRQANLRMLCHRAAEWEKTHMDGLHGFVESLQMDGGSAETGPAVLDPADDVVRIMTIHKSKGLEFPTVYVMNLGRSLFGRPSAKSVSIHDGVGWGLGYVNEQARTKRGTLLSGAVSLREKNAERAERARVLYVALTRPKSRLVMVGSAKMDRACLPVLINRAQTGSDVYAVREAGSMLEWILQCVQPYDSLEQFSYTGAWEKAEPTAFSTLSTGFPQKWTPWRVVFHMESGYYRENSSKTDMQPLPLPVIPEGELSTSDPFAHAFSRVHLPLKVGVTALCRALADNAPDVSPDEETAEVKRLPFQPRIRSLSSLPQLPAFMAPPKEERALTQGVATHRVLGLIDLDAVRPHAAKPKALYAAVCRECERMAAAGILPPEELNFINRSMIARFLESPLGQRMLASPRVEREWSFNLRIREPFSTIAQGVIDLCFLEADRWILVDFKTDRVQSADELIPRYARQLSYYRQALECGTPYGVQQCVLYSLRLGEGVEV